MKESDTYLKKLEASETFGEFAFFTGCNRFSSVKAEDYVSAVRFKRKDLLECIDSIGKEHLAILKDRITIYSDFSIFDITCYSCRGKNHTAKNCKYTHLEINNRNLIRSKKVETNIRRICIRNNRRQFSAICAQTEVMSAILEVNIEKKRSKISSLT